MALNKSHFGIPSTEYGCGLPWEGVRKDVKLIFLQEECRWIYDRAEKDRRHVFLLIGLNGLCLDLNVITY